MDSEQRKANCKVDSIKQKGNSGLVYAERYIVIITTPLSTQTSEPAKHTHVQKHTDTRVCMCVCVCVIHFQMEFVYISKKYEEETHMNLTEPSKTQWTFSNRKSLNKQMTCWLLYINKCNKHFL